jgi:Domain of unknown function (DUF6265)
MRIWPALVVIVFSSVVFAEPRLAWLEGRWTGSQGGIEMEEIWTSPSGGALVGMHKDVKGGKMVGFEFLRIDGGPEGLVYHASPNAAPATPFRLLELGDKRVVFFNETHDFPQRILYWLDATGAMHARIEGTDGGKPRAQEWTWKKARP